MPGNRRSQNRLKVNVFEDGQCLEAEKRRPLSPLHWQRLDKLEVLDKPSDDLPYSAGEAWIARIIEIDLDDFLETSKDGDEEVECRELVLLHAVLGDGVAAERDEIGHTNLILFFEFLDSKQLDVTPRHQELAVSLLRLSNGGVHEKRFRQNVGAFCNTVEIVTDLLKEEIEHVTEFVTQYEPALSVCKRGRFVLVAEQSNLATHDHDLKYVVRTDELRTLHLQRPGVRFDGMAKRDV